MNRIQEASGGLPFQDGLECNNEASTIYAVAIKPFSNGVSDVEQVNSEQNISRHRFWTESTKPGFS